MSTFQVTIEKLKLLPHNNADSLEIAQIRGYQAVVAKGIHTDGNLIAYIPEAGVVPEWLISKMELTGRLAGSNHNRVKAIKLRSELSQGLVYPLSKNNDKWYLSNEKDQIEVKEGDDVTDFLGVEKYIPEIPTHMAGEVYNAYGKTVKFDIENIKNYPNVLKDGEEVVVTEKTHGTWCCLGVYPNDTGFEHIVASKGNSEKGLAFKDNDVNTKNVYMQMFKSDPKYLDTLIALSWNYNTSPIYMLGEIFGAGIQDLTYGSKNKQFRVFDIYVGQPGQGYYLDSDVVMYLCNKHNIQTMPILYSGPFNKEKIMEVTSGKETLSGSEAHIREGVVIRPKYERRDEEIGRVILKSISPDYLLRKGNATEFT
jgi:RNA ligase (TIGR02306 family)